MELITAAELSVYLQRPEIRSDASAIVACSLASGWVREYCGWPISFVNQVDFDDVDGNGTRSFTLPTLRLTSIDQVWLDDAQMDASEWVFSRNGTLWRTYGIWPRRPRCISVRGVNHGYEAIPQGVKLASLSIAAREYNNPEGLAEATSGTVRRKYAPRELESHLLDRYRLPGSP